VIYTVPMGTETFQFQNMQVTAPCRVRVYGTMAAAVADQARISTVDPTGNHGMYLEMLFNAANLVWTVTPIATIENQDVVENGAIYMTVQNLGASTGTITITGVYLGMEITGSSTSSWMLNPMTSVGDLIVGSTAGSPSRLSIGANAYVLTSNGTTASWQPSTGGGGASWGSITGTLSAQTDLNSALNGKQPLATSLTTFSALANANGYLSNNGSGVLTWTAGTGGVAWGSITGTLSAQTDLNTALGNLQPLATPLTNFAALSNASGVLTNNGTGTLSWGAAYTLPTATSTVLGGVKPDNVSILNAAGVLTATAASVGAVPAGGNAGTATSLAAGTANQIPYQTGAGVTSFFSAANYGVPIYGATGVPQSIAGAAGVLIGSASAIPAWSTYLPAAQFPAMTGDVTSVAGALATTLATTQSAVHTWSAAQTFSSTLNKVTITAPTTSATLTLVTGSTLQTTGAFTLNLTTTAASTPTFPAGSGTLAYLGGTNTWSAAQTFGSTINKVTITAPTTSATLTLVTGSTLVTAGAFSLTLTTTATTVATFPAGTTTLLQNVLTTTGDLMYSSSGTTPARLGVGSSGQVLGVSAGLPAWVNSTADMLSSIVNAEIAVSGATTATILCWHNCTATSANYALTLPTAASSSGKLLGIRIDPSSTYLVTVTGNGAETIDGSNTRIMWANEVAVLKSNGTTWTKVSGKTIPMVSVLGFQAAQLFSASTLTKVNLTTSLQLTAPPAFQITAWAQVTILRPGNYRSEICLVYNLNNASACIVQASLCKNGANAVDGYNYAQANLQQSAINASLLPFVAGDALTAYGFFGAGSYTTSTLIVDVSPLSRNSFIVTEIPTW